MIAALGMYDRAETASANDAFYGLIRDHLRAAGIAAPDRLVRGDLAYMAGWQSPDLLVSQTCSLPYRAVLFDQVDLIGTPDYGLQGCAPGYYNSVYVVRAADPRAQLAAFAGSSFARNDALSHSGWAAPWADHRARGLTLTPTLTTGGHRASGLAVAQGLADYAALDALTWAMMQRYDSFAADLRVLDHTKSSPALPYITRKHGPSATLFHAIAAAIAALPQDLRAILHLRALVSIDAATYRALPQP